MRTLLASLFIALFAAACGSASPTPGQPAGGGDFAPFSARDLDGKSLNLADHVGRDVILVSFWATYCEPCKAEMPILQRFHDSYAKDGLAIVSVALDGPDTAAEVAPYIRKQGYSFRCVLDESGDIAQSLNPSATAPYALLVDRKGHVVKRITGFQASEAPALEAEIKTLLATSAL
jgi:thiol-disulfide isomerase/thioredoxin